MRFRIKTLMIAIAAVAVVFGIVRWLVGLNPMLAIVVLVSGATVLLGCWPFAVAYRFRSRGRD